ncbi:MAG: alpha-galactosidase/6-phospho-beta-glucosidase family protein, partial [Hyphomicrobiaceae bacterium]
SKDLVIQALLVDPVVDRIGKADALVRAMVEMQSEHLGYLR